MDLWHIRGGRPLEGSWQVQGSKNASLPILAATVLSPCRCCLYRVPRLRDVDTALEILRALGCRVLWQDEALYIDSRSLSGCAIPRELMERMRSSVIFMGALLARCGEAQLSLPGGCRLGKRPIDLHLSALRAMGADIREDGDEILCRPARLHGAELLLPFPSVGATENAMLAACGAGGRSCIHGAAREPEITALQDFLRAMGAQISGAGTGTIVVEGFRPREQVCARIQPDRIAAATLACACAAAGGEIELKAVQPRHFSALLYFLKQAGCDIINNNRTLRVASRSRLRAVGPVETAPYPGFPTDAQPLLMAALLRSRGCTVITETIFENRFRQVPELCRLGASVRVEGRRALIRGVERLEGAALQATDLRGGAAMILAGLAADGETLVMDRGHIRRGYEDLDGCLSALGAELQLEQEQSTEDNNYAEFPLRRSP